MTWLVDADEVVELPGPPLPDKREVVLRELEPELGTHTVEIQGATGRLGGRSSDRLQVIGAVMA